MHLLAPSNILSPFEVIAFILSIFFVYSFVWGAFLLMLGHWNLTRFGVLTVLIMALFNPIVYATNQGQDLQVMMPLFSLTCVVLLILGGLLYAAVPGVLKIWVPRQVIAYTELAILILFLAPGLYHLILFVHGLIPFTLLCLVVLVLIPWWGNQSYLKRHHARHTKKANRQAKK